MGLSDDNNEGVKVVSDDGGSDKCKDGNGLDSSIGLGEIPVDGSNDGFMVGLTVGDNEGDELRNDDGESVKCKDGNRLGFSLGAREGPVVGLNDGCKKGPSDDNEEDTLGSDDG